MGWLRAILRPGSTRMMTVLGTGRGRLLGMSRVVLRASVRGDFGRCSDSLIREGIWLPDRPADTASRQHPEPLVGVTSIAKNRRGRESKYPYWWRGHLPIRDGGQRCGTPNCRCHGARQNQPPNQVNQCEAPLGKLAVTPPCIMGGRAAGEPPPAIRNSLGASRRSVVGFSPMPVAGASKTLPLVHSVVSTT